MAKIPEQKEGLTEIRNYAWVIHVYGKDYLYHGPESGIKDAVRQIANLPRSAGSKVTYKKIVS